MSSNEPQSRPRRSRKSIAAMPSSSALTVGGEVNNTAAAAPKAAKKSRSKSLGPGGLDALNAGGKGLKDGSGNGRRASLAPTIAVKSILKPTLPLSPIQPIPTHRSRTNAPTFTIAPMTSNPPPRSSTAAASSSSISSASSSSNTLNFNPPPPTTVPVHTEEEQQRRSKILAARAARRQSLGGRRVSFAPEATLHTWDVIEYYRSDAASTPGSNSTGHLSTIEATPTSSTATPESPRLPDPTNTFAPVTPGKVGDMGFGSPAMTDAGFSSPFSSSPVTDAAESPFAMGGSDSDSTGSDSEGEGAPGDRTFVTNAGDTTMGDMTMDVDVSAEELTGGFRAFGKRTAWKLEGETEAVENAEKEESGPLQTAPENAENNEEDGEMTMEMTKAVGGLIPSTPVAYPSLPEPAPDNEDEGGEMTMEMTRAIGGLLPSSTAPMFIAPVLGDGADMTMDMDMTRPVGGILSSAASLLERAKRKSLSSLAPPQHDESDIDTDVEMDMTVAVGGILSGPAPEHDAASSPVQDMTMDMDFTRPVGGILPAPSTRFVSSPAQSEVENEEMTMEFTSVLGGIIGRMEEKKAPEKAKGRRSSLARGGGAGRLMSAEAWQREQNAQRGEREDEGGGEMDMTVAVGGILPAPAVTQAQQVMPKDERHGDSTDEEDIDMDGVTMDITTAIGSILPSTSVINSTTNSVTKLPRVAEWGPAPVPTPMSAQKVGTPTPVKRRSGSRRNSATASGEPRVTRRSSAASRRSLDMQEQSSTPVPVAAPVSEPIQVAASKTATPQKSETPVQKVQTPKQRATPQSQTEKRTPKQKSETPKSETSKPMFIFATPQKKTAAQLQPQTPPEQVTPVVKPKTPSKHTPVIETPVNHGFSLGAKKALGFPTSPSPFRQAGTPGTPGMRGIGIGKPGLGSPRVAAKLSSRRSIGETTLPFSPVAAPHELLRASQEDDAADREDERREKELEMERRKSLDLRSRIELLTPRKAARKSLAYGALLQEQGKRGREDDTSIYLGDGKRRKSLEYGLAAQSPTRVLRSMDLDKAPSLPSPRKQTPRKRAIIALVPEVSSPPAPPLKPEPEVVVVEESEEESFEDEEEPKLTLQQFLSMTSISFLDGLTTTKRRHTGFPGLDFHRNRRSTDTEDEQEASLADCVIAGACTVPMLDLFQHSCRELKKYIKEGRKVVKEIEVVTQEENPLLFREYIDAPPDVKVIMDTQFKNVKTHARFLAKGIWYEWRTKLLEDVRTALEDNLQSMKADEAAIEEGVKAAESVLPELKARFEDLKKVATRMDEVERRIESDDKEQLGEARERLTSVQQRIEETKKKLEKRQQEVKEVDVNIASQEKKKVMLQECIEEAERVKEMNRGWSEEEVSAWKSKVIALEQKFGWSVSAVHGTSIELVFLKQLRIAWDATGTENTKVEYMAPATTKPSDPTPLQDVERDFFITSLNIRLSNTTKQTLKQTVNEIDAFWRRCLSTADEIRKVRRMYPIALTSHNQRELKIAIKVLVPEIRSKVVIEVVINRDMAVKGGAKVLYGGVNEAAVHEFVSNALKEGTEGAWKSVVENVVGRCLEGQRRGGVGVPTKA